MSKDPKNTRKDLSTPSSAELKNEYQKFLSLSQQPSPTENAQSKAKQQSDYPATSPFDPAMKTSDPALGNSEPAFLAELKSTISPSVGSLILKFIPVALISVFISLFLCPQFGMTPYKIEPDFISHLLHQNMFICGLYCGLVLYGALNLGSYLYFNHYEKLQFKRQLSFVPFALAGLLWGGFMWASNSHYSESIKYNLGWILAIVLGLAYSLYSSKKALKMAVKIEKY